MISATKPSRMASTFSSSTLVSSRTPTLDHERPQNCESRSPSELYVCSPRPPDFTHSRFLVCPDAVPYAPLGTYGNDPSVDSTTGQRMLSVVHRSNSETAAISIKFTNPGTHSMKAHCPSGFNHKRSARDPHAVIIT